MVVPTCIFWDPSKELGIASRRPKDDINRWVGELNMCNGVIVS